MKCPRMVGWIVVLVCQLMVLIGSEKFETAPYADYGNIVISLIEPSPVHAKPIQITFQGVETDILSRVDRLCADYDIDATKCQSIYEEAQLRLSQWQRYDTVEQPIPSQHFGEYFPSLPVEQQQQRYPALNTNYNFVTAFYDLGRGDWSGEYKRSADSYLRYFSKLLQTNMPLIVFIDDRYYSQLTRLVNQYNRQSYVLLIRMNEQFLEENIASWKYIATEAAIMRSSEHRERLSGRPVPNTPETFLPRYTCFTHAKIDFVTYIIRNGIAVNISGKPVDYLGWIDFGYLHEDFEVLPFELNDQLLMPALSQGQRHQVSIMTNNYVRAEDGDPLWTVMNAPFKICALEEYSTVYHTSVAEFHARGVADDEQAIMIYAYSRHRDLIKAWKNLNMVSGAEYLGVFVAQIVFNKLMARDPNVEAFIAGNR